MILQQKFKKWWALEKRQKTRVFDFWPTWDRFFPSLMIISFLLLYSFTSTSNGLPSLNFSRNYFENQGHPVHLKINQNAEKKTKKRVFSRAVANLTVVPQRDQNAQKHLCYSGKGLQKVTGPEVFLLCHSSCLSEKPKKCKN